MSKVFMMVNYCVEDVYMCVCCHEYLWEFVYMWGLQRGTKVNEIFIFGFNGNYVGKRGTVVNWCWRFVCDVVVSMWCGYKNS